MSAFSRLQTGGRIDRRTVLRFSFDGRSMSGYAGDTLASALLANGVCLMGRSFKYHRPRGVVGAGVEEPNALVEIDRGHGRREPNVQATTVELYDGLVARSQNRWPSLRFDIGAVNGLGSKLIPAGFYYKTFMWPAWAWKKIYEPNIRRAAGLGRPPVSADPDRYDARFSHCELLIVGAGPAGLAAALAASDQDKRIILCDEGSELGGSLLRDPFARIDGIPAGKWIDKVRKILASRPNVKILTRATAFRYGTHNMVDIAERVSDHMPPAGGPELRQRWHRVRAEQVILATGAHERPVLFGRNDLPGVMLASAAQTYVARYGVRFGRKAVVLTRGDSGYSAAATLARSGLKVCICDLRSAAPADLKREAVAIGITVLEGTRPVRAKGRSRVRSIEVQLANGKNHRLACDVVLMAGGWTPAIHLFSQARGKTRFEEAIEAYVPANALDGIACVGACRGDFGLGAALEQGFVAGRAGGDWASTQTPPRCDHRDRDYDMRNVPIALGGTTSMAFIDYQNDVTTKDLRLAVREGFLSVEHFKRFTTTGMATDQGRTSNLNAMAVAGDAMGVTMGEVGITTFRPPYTPIPFGTLAGYNRGDTCAPSRRTPSHDWAVTRGAVFEDVGLWKRARYFPRDGEDMESAVRRECRITRATAGILDASTLGKIEVVGPDAAEFMNRMYVNAWSKLKVGSCRYGVLLREDGYVFDDGVVGRIADDRFHVTTTSGGAANVFNLMEDYLQTEWPDLDVWLTSTTEQWAVIAVQGPKARNILEPLVEGIDLSHEGFPHMSVREGKILGVPTRLFRVSFTGELGFEVNVPSSHGTEIWNAIIAEGERHGAAPYGTEASHVLRAEKGFIIVGQETDGTVTPDDVGLSWAIGKTKPDFVGKRSLARPDLVRTGRKQLVGLRPIGHERVPDEGAQLISTGPASRPSSQGHVTSAYWSDAAGGPIALALLADGRARHGETIEVTTLGGPPTPWRIGEPVFFDPAGERVNA